MRRSLLLLLVCLLNVTSLSADDFSASDLYPFVHVHASGTRTDFFGGNNFDDTYYYISRSGALLVVKVTQRTGGVILVNKSSSVLIRGIGEQVRINQMKRSIHESRIGIQRSCKIDAQAETNGPLEITWHGKGERRNSFIVVFGTSGASDLPVCPAEVEAMIQSINDYENHVAHQPGTEILASE